MEPEKAETIITVWCQWCGPKRIIIYCCIFVLACLRFMLTGILATRFAFYYLFMFPDRHAKIVGHEHLLRPQPDLIHHRN